MKAIVHIGTEKTGTTTIQHFLYSNRELLKSRGIDYPRTPGLRDHRKLAVYAMNLKQVDAFIRRHNLASPQKRQEWKKGFKAKLDEELSLLDARIHTVIFSSEHLHSRLWGEPAIRKFKQLLSPWFEEIEILVYLRRQDRVAVSSYSTKLKVGGTPDHILNQKVKPSNHYYNYYRLLNNWGSVFGKNHIKVKLFESASFHNNDLISDFLASTGINEKEQWSRPESLNEKLSWQSQHFLRRYNCRYPRFDKSGYNKLNDNVRRELLSRLEFRYPGRGELPTRGDAISFYDKFKEDNRLLAREWFDRERLFKEDFSEYPERKQKHKLTPVAILYFEMIVQLLRFRLSRSSPAD